MTIKDVAKHCGVSVSTVSRVLNDHPYVSSDVRRRVEKAIEELHFVPNGGAVDLVKPRQDAIGLIVRGVGNPFFSEILPAIEDSINSAGYTMILQQIHSENDELRSAAALARSKRLRGVILLGGRFDYTPEETALLGVPFVCCSFTNIFGTLDKSCYAAVSIDDRAEACRAVSHLLDKGHRRIGIILDSVCDHSISQLRYEGYCEALRELGIEPDPQLVETVDSFSMEAAYQGTKRLLKRRDDFTSMFVISDSMAIAAIRALHEAGKKVPEDCSVIAIDGIAMSAYSVPALTTLVQPKTEMGQAAVDTLLAMMDGKSFDRSIILKAALRKGESVRELQ